MAKKETTQTLERTYNVPLRKEYLKTVNWRRTEKAVTALKQFLVKHMKSENVKLDPSINELLWKHGLKNPPHHIKVTASKNDKGEVTAKLFGAQETKGKTAPRKVEKVKKEETKTI